MGGVENNINVPPAWCIYDVSGNVLHKGPCDFETSSFPSDIITGNNAAGVSKIIFNNQITTVNESSCCNYSNLRCVVFNTDDVTIGDNCFKGC